MRNIHLLEQFMQENGIEYDVPFTIERTGYLGERELMNVKISKSDDYTGFELSYADSTKQMGNSSAVMQELMFSDKMRIIKKPWKPKNGEEYWYVWFDESCDCCVGASHWERNSADFTRYVVKNCFKTQKEAVEHADEVLKTLSGEPLVKREE